MAEHIVSKRRYHSSTQTIGLNIFFHYKIVVCFSLQDFLPIFDRSNVTRAQAALSLPLLYDINWLELLCRICWQWLIFWYLELFHQQNSFLRRTRFWYHSLNKFFAAFHAMPRYQKTLRVVKCASNHSCLDKGNFCIYSTTEGFPWKPFCHRQDIIFCLMLQIQIFT